jgi:hypothetical protein
MIFCEQHPARAMASPVMPLPGQTADNEPTNISAGQGYRTSSPVTVRPMIIRWIVRSSDAPIAVNPYGTFCYLRRLFRGVTAAV